MSEVKKVTASMLINMLSCCDPDAEIHLDRNGMWLPADNVAISENEVGKEIICLKSSALSSYITESVLTETF